MNGKEFMMQYKECQVNIMRLRLDIAKLRDEAGGLTSSGFDRDRVQSSHDPDKMGKIIAKMADLEDEWTEEILRCCDIMEEIENVVGQIRKPGCQRLLHLRYMEDYMDDEMSPEERAARMNTWEICMRETNYSSSGIWNLHERAIKEVEKIIGLSEANDNSS